MSYDLTWHMLYDITWHMLYNITWHMLYNIYKKASNKEGFFKWEVYDLLNK